MYYDFKTVETEGEKAYYLGQYASGVQIDVAAKYPKFSSLTKDNFVVVPQNAYVEDNKQNSQSISSSGWTLIHVDTNVASYTAPNVTYNSSTGKLSFSASVVIGGTAYNTDTGGVNIWARTNPSKAAALTAKVYLLPEVEDIS